LESLVRCTESLVDMLLGDRIWISRWVWRIRGVQYTRNAVVVVATLGVLPDLEVSEVRRVIEPAALVASQSRLGYAKQLPGDNRQHYSQS